MRNLVVIAGLALVLTGCQTYQERRAASGALLGGATGALIGGLAGGTAGAAVAGGAIGAASGAIIGAATTPRYCDAQTASGRWVRVRC
ncbi:MAG: glycine zipper domain-containing protein [Pseudomonadota bacterium]|jgi:hypothetical protein